MLITFRYIDIVGQTTVMTISAQLVQVVCLTEGQTETAWVGKLILRDVIEMRVCVILWLSSDAHETAGIHLSL